MMHSVMKQQAAAFVRGTIGDDFSGEAASGGGAGGSGGGGGCGGNGIAAVLEEQATATGDVGEPAAASADAAVPAAATNG